MFIFFINSISSINGFKPGYTKNKNINKHQVVKKQAYCPGLRLGIGIVKKMVQCGIVVAPVRHKE